MTEFRVETIALADGAGLMMRSNGGVQGSAAQVSGTEGAFAGTPGSWGWDTFAVQAQTTLTGSVEAIRSLSTGLRAAAAAYELVDQTNARGLSAQQGS